ncbi:MAG: hypothetical protein H0U04_13650 [Rubrobacter sp.]|nr:hypothetical protein [Rubrobacter sp.]
MSEMDSNRRIYGIAEIAAELQVRRETVAQWHNRRQLPEPDEQLAMGPTWLAKTIEPWIKTKRLHISGKVLMSTNLGMVVWFLFLGGLVWANLSTHRRLDEACASESAVAIEEAACSYGNVLHASEQFESFTRGVLKQEEGR